MPKLILIRHGQSQWNLENRFTGWWDVNVTEKGAAEAWAAGELMKKMGIAPDIGFTSVQTRAIKTLNLALEAMGRLWLPVTKDWQQVIVFIAIASMVLGAFAAIGQTNIKRLMAYSSIGHVGFALVGLAAGSEAGVRGVAIYMIIYLIMTLGTFAFILSMQTKDRQVEEIADLAGLSKTNPYRALILTILMFSLAGIPPLAGFFAKWYVFLAAIQANLLALSIIGVLASVVGAYYYLRIIKIMWFDEPAAGFVAAPSLINAVLGISGAFVLFYVIVGGPVEALAAAAAKTFF